MESLMATAFGRYVSIQNGEGNELTDAASEVFLFMRESHEYSPDLLLLLLCELGLATHCIVDSM